MRSNSDAQITNQSVAKMIFKPELCSGFIWPPYQCKFKTQQPGINADPQELRIHHYQSRNISTAYKNKTLSKQDGYILLSVDSKRHIQENEDYYLHENKYREQPMYIEIPEFLKKLKIKECERDPHFKL
jgi:hypothetical protein